MAAGLWSIEEGRWPASLPLRVLLFAATFAPPLNGQLASVESSLSGLGALGSSPTFPNVQLPTWGASTPVQAAGLSANAAGYMGQQYRAPLIIGGMEFSRDDDIENVEKLTNLFGQVFYTKVLAPGDTAAQSAWQGLSEDIWALASYAAQEPSLSLAVSMMLYNYFWWEGPQSVELNVRAGRLAAELMYASLGFGGCRDSGASAMEFFIRQCPMRWRYTLMLAGEVGRHLVLQRREIGAGAELLRQLKACFQEMRQLPQFSRNSGSAGVPHEVNFNMDYFPSAVARKGPVWKDPLKDVPIAAFLEENYHIIRGELDAILAGKDTFNALDERTRNAETQFGPRGDDWLTAYMVRNAEWFDFVCAHAPRTCELLRTRPEVAQCRSAGSGAGFLRMRPGGRLKPHFGNAPRLSVHLGLIVPDGEIRMSVGYESVRWEEGRALVFDDTFIHSVVHNGVEPRYVLNVWMCHPCDPSNGKHPGEGVPSYCEGPPGTMAALGLQPLPSKR